MSDAEYTLLVEESVQEFLQTLDAKSERICKETLSHLATNPYPGRGRGDKEGGIVVDGQEVYRMHISRTFTAFYEVDEAATEVRVLELLPIDEAHKRYGT